MPDESPVGQTMAAECSGCNVITSLFRTEDHSGGWMCSYCGRLNHPPEDLDPDYGFRLASPDLVDAVAHAYQLPRRFLDGSQWGDSPQRQHVNAWLSQLNAQPVSVGGRIEFGDNVITLDESIVIPTEISRLYEMGSREPIFSSPVVAIAQTPTSDHNPWHDVVFHTEPVGFDLLGGSVETVLPNQDTDNTVPEAATSGYVAVQQDDPRNASTFNYESIATELQAHTDDIAQTIREGIDAYINRHRANGEGATVRGQRVVSSEEWATDSEYHRELVMQELGRAIADEIYCHTARAVPAFDIAHLTNIVHASEVDEATGQVTLTAEIFVPPSVLNPGPPRESATNEHGMGINDYFHADMAALDASWAASRPSQYDVATGSWTSVRASDGVEVDTTPTEVPEPTQQISQPNSVFTPGAIQAAMEFLDNEPLEASHIVMNVDDARTLGMSEETLERLAQLYVDDPTIETQDALWMNMAERIIQRQHGESVLPITVNYQRLIELIQSEDGCPPDYSCDQHEDCEDCTPAERINAWVDYLGGNISE